MMVFLTFLVFVMSMSFGMIGFILGYGFGRKDEQDRRPAPLFAGYQPAAKAAYRNVPPADPNVMQ